MDAKGTEGIFTLELEGSVTDGNEHGIVWTADYAAIAPGVLLSHGQTIGMEGVRTADEVAQNLACGWSHTDPKATYDPSKPGVVVFDSDTAKLYCGKEIGVDPIEIAPGLCAKRG